MPTLHIISHTHWDREWYRSFQSFRLKLVHLIDGLLELLDNDPNYKYFMLDGQTIVLDDYLAMRPEKEEILRRHIQKGRILIGPWHILPDMFLVGPESHIRNLLKGDQTARRFGPKMMVGYIPDPFGHPGQVPQILKGFGIETACLWRGLDDQPAEFWWQAPDGSRVLMAYLRDSYSNGAALPANNPEAFASLVKAAGDSLTAHSAVPEALIMFGTDHMEPPPGTSKAIAYANETLGDYHVVHSTLPKFVAAIQEDIEKQKLDLPTVTGELRACKRMHLLPGVLSTRIWIKQRNHASENLLTKWVEPFSVFAGLLTTDYKPSSTVNDPWSIIHFAWCLLMENHPHDSICGCSIDQVHNEMKVRFDQVDQVGDELTVQSLDTLAANIQTESDHAKSAIVVFNPTSQARRDTVDATVELPVGVDDFQLVDEQGNSLPYQAQGFESRDLINMVLDAKGFQSAFGAMNDGRAAGMSIQDLRIRQEGAQVFIEAVMVEDGEPNLAVWKAGLKQINELLADPGITEFHVHARSVPVTQIVLCTPPVPGFGYRTLWVCPCPIEEKAPVRMRGLLVRVLLPLAKLPIMERLAARQHASRPPYRIENEFFCIEVKRDGTLTLADKRNGQSYSGLNAFKDGGDCGDEYNYSPPISDLFSSSHLKRVKVVNGPVHRSMEIELELTTPISLEQNHKTRSKKVVKLPVTTMVTLTNAVPRLDIHTTVENIARDHRLRVHFPAAFAAGSGNQDGHFEVVEREVGLPAFDETWIEEPRPEVPQRAFTDVSDGKSGLMLANRGLPEVEVLKNSQGNAEIALTLLRCTGWLSRDDFTTRKGHAGPFIETPGAQMQGKWSYDYSIIPHSGNWQSAFWQAYAFETPLRAAATGMHAGVLPSSGSFIETTPEAFVVSAVKRSEDRRGWLVRGYNITGEPINVAIQPWKIFKKASQINLAEEKLGSLKLGPTGGVSLPVRGHEIISILFES